MSSIVGYLTMAPVESWPFDCPRVMAVIDWRVGLDVGWAAIDTAEAPNARETYVWATYRIVAGGSRLIVTSSRQGARVRRRKSSAAGRVFLGAGRRGLVKSSHRAHVEE
jgi:hypothetical protein